MKLFKVRVEFETVICAKDKREAEMEAEYIIKNEDDGSCESVYAEEIIKISDLPNGWDADCLPYNDNRNLMIGEILGE